MSALTKKERDGLEDVFLSIHANIDKYKKIKKLSSLILPKRNLIFFSNIVKYTKHEVKGLQNTNLLSIFHKKKKNLSK